MHLCSIVAARPNFMKLAGFHHAFTAAKIPGWQHSIVHTGQHHNPLLSNVFFRELDIPEPDANLGVKGGATNEETVARTREACVPVLQRLQPNLVLVYGDVSGALGGAQAAKELGIAVAHVEAGLRSFDQTMPEERNRIAIDRLADLLFVTERSGVENLQREGITRGVHLVGNTMIDTLQRMGSLLQQSPPLRHPERFAVVTLHRPSNVDAEAALQENIRFLEHVAEQCPIVFPLHPRTAAALQKFSLQLPPSIHVSAPLGYIEFLRLVHRADFILTDSGGIQEEAAFLGKKCFTLRKNTERPCTLEENGGSNTLIDLAKEEDRQNVLAYATNPVMVAVRLPKEWDGRAGERIMDILRRS